MRSPWGGCEAPADAAERMAREEHRRKAAERAEREGWGQEPVGEVQAHEVAYDPGDPFCPCQECRAKTRRP